MLLHGMGVDALMNSGRLSSEDVERMIADAEKMRAADEARAQTVRCIAFPHRCVLFVLHDDFSRFHPHCA